MQKFLKIILICPLIIISLLTFYYVNIKPTLACLAFVRAVGEQKDFNKTILNYKEGVSKNTIFDDDFREELSAKLILIFDSAKLPEKQKGEIMEILKEQKPFLEKQFGKPDRRYLDAYQLVALINEKIYLIEGDSSALKAMEEVVRKVLDFNPQKIEFYRLMGQTKILQGQYQEGEAFFQKYFELIPQKGLTDERDFYISLAGTYYAAGQKLRAADSYKKAIEIELCLKKFDKGSGQEIQQALIFTSGVVGLYYNELNDKETALKIYRKAREVFPKEINKYYFPEDLLSNY